MQREVRRAEECGRSRRRPSDDLLDAGSLEAAGAALLLDLTGRSVASAPPAGQGGARGQLDVLLVHAWRTEDRQFISIIAGG